VIYTAASKVLQSLLPHGFEATVGLILGSGLNHLADAIENPVRVDYSELPGFFKSTVVGHAGACVCGTLEGVNVICMQGRQHLYEGATLQHIVNMIHTIKAMGAQTLIVTNAAGSLNMANKPGSVVMIKDHINFQGVSPLTGPNNSAIGPRFVSMENAYDARLRNAIHAALYDEGEPALPEGVYLGVLGPEYETPAEIRAYRTLGADLVGMSTVNEVLVARHVGLKVLGFSAVSNYAAGMEKTEIRHDLVVETAAHAGKRLGVLVQYGLRAILQM
jgi:inosine/guanosine/xanthosine phosphorylase family protein